MTDSERKFGWVDDWAKMTGERARIDAKVHKTAIVYNTKMSKVKEFYDGTIQRMDSGESKGGIMREKERINRIMFSYKEFGSSNLICDLTNWFLTCSICILFPKRRIWSKNGDRKRTIWGRSKIFLFGLFLLGGWQVGRIPAKDGWWSGKGL